MISTRSSRLPTAPFRPRGARWLRTTTPSTTSHGAIDITLVGAVIPSLSTAAEPSAKETAKLIDEIRAEGVCAVFSESSVDPKLGRQVAEESGATIYPDLYGDSLGPMGSDGATYLGMMRHNQRVLVKGFACKRT